MTFEYDRVPLVTTSCCLWSGFLDPVSRVRPFHLSPSRFDSGEAVAFSNFPLVSAFRYWYLYWILLYIIFVGVTVKIFVSSNLCPSLSFCEMLCKYSDNRCIVLSSMYVSVPAYILSICWFVCNGYFRFLSIKELLWIKLILCVCLD